MKKIGHKIAAAIAISTVIVSLLIGSISITKGNSIITNLAANQMEFTAKSTSENLDTANSTMEEKVNNITLSISSLFDIEKLKTNPNYISEFSNMVDPIIKNYSSTSKGIMGAYMCFDPKLTNQVYEIWYADKDGSGKFEKQKFADITEYNPDNKNMAWYYEPIKLGKGVWSQPYLDEDIKVYMISYTQPVYVNSVLVGVAGIDFRYDDYKQKVNNIKFFNTGYAYLLDKEFNFLVHPSYKDTENLKKVSDGKLEPIAKAIEKDNLGIMNYNFNDTDQILAYSRLSNGQTLVVCAPKIEVLKDMIKLKNNLIAVSLIIVIISILAALLLGRLISKPILKLAVLINKTTELDFVPDKTYEGIDKYKDEIGVMARAIISLRKVLRDMAGELINASENIKEKVNNVKGLTDSLTLEAKHTYETTKNLSIGMTEVSASVEEINTGTFEIEKSISDTLERSVKGNKVSMDVSSRAVALKDDAINSKRNAENIYQNVKSELQVAINNSKEVSKINILAQSILEITEQTNLLALNASIEASRAGEAGKGFAVVAEEIRKLSDESSKTVEGIKEVIQVVNTSVDYLVANSEKILSFIEKDVLSDYEKLIKTGEQYNLDAELFNNFMTNFSETANQLNTSINSVASAIDEITAAVNQGACGVDDIADKSENIVEEINSVKDTIQENLLNAEKLNELVAKMKI